MRNLLIAAGLALMTAASPAVAQTTITFDDLAEGAEVNTQYPGVTFSSVAGSRILTTAQSLGSSLPNFICTAPAGGTIDCTNTVFVDFATAVSGLSFLAVGDNQAGVNGSVDVFGSGGAALGSIDILGDNDFFSPFTVDLSAFSGVTRIAVNTVDPGGLGYDDFTFTAGFVPEPATWAMMLLGFGAVGYTLRRRRPAGSPSLA